MKILAVVFCISFFISSACNLEKPKQNQVYIFSYFKNNGEDGLHLAYSMDGLKWKSLSRDSSFLTPEVGGKLMRDPCIIKGPDETYHMVWTTSWSDKGIGIAHSKDLINWSEQAFVPVMAHLDSAVNCWAPEITWDKEKQQYVIYWATTILGQFPETAKDGHEGNNHRMYYTTTKDFVKYSSAKLFYDPGFQVIDGTIQPFDNGYVMILKDETLHPPAKSLKVTFSSHVAGPWSKASEAFTDDIEGWKEGPTLFKRDSIWIVMFDIYNREIFGAMKTRDFKTWVDISHELECPEGMRHGTVVKADVDLIEAIISAE